MIETVDRILIAVNAIDHILGTMTGIVMQIALIHGI
jgi:hypothetical protein